MKQNQNNNYVQNKMAAIAGKLLKQLPAIAIGSFDVT
jgi:hypothetical protein